MDDLAGLVSLAVRGDNQATSRLDLAVDTAVMRRDFAAVDVVLRPLAVAAIEGSDRALEILLGLLDNHGIVRATVAKHLSDADLIDDACQDTLLLVARNLGTYEGRSRVTTWVYPIAANAARMITRGRSRRPEDPASELPPVHASLRHMSSIVVGREQVRAAIGELDELYRVPLELREIDALSYAEIAERLDISVGTVKSRIARARERLAHHLGM